MDGSSNIRKKPPRDAASKVAQQRMGVLEMARELGNVAEACRQRGMDRTSFPEWKQRFRTQGFDGLRDLPPIHKTHPQAPEIVKRIRALAPERPAYGCNRLEAILPRRARGSRRSPFTSCSNDHGLGTRIERRLTLEEASAGKVNDGEPLERDRSG